MEIEGIDTGRGVVEGRLAEEYFVTIAREYLAAGKGRTGKGSSCCMEGTILPSSWSRSSGSAHRAAPDR